MARLDVIPEIDRGVIMLQVSDETGAKLGAVDLTPELLEQTFAHLLAAWGIMDKGAGVPGAVGTWTNTPTIEGPAWMVGARPFDGAVTLGLCPGNFNGRELWLTNWTRKHVTLIHHAAYRTFGAWKKARILSG